MRKAARIAGLIWLILVALAGVTLLVVHAMGKAGVSSNRALIYIVFGAALPGVMLYRWGRGAHERPIPTREVIPRAYPPKTANEMGHVRRE